MADSLVKYDWKHSNIRNGYGRYFTLGNELYVSDGPIYKCDPVNGSARDVVDPRAFNNAVENKNTDVNTTKAKLEVLALIQELHRVTESQSIYDRAAKLIAVINETSGNAS